MIAVRSSTPWRRKWFMRSMSTIAFVTTMPTSMSRPTIEVMPSGVSVSSDRPIEPVAANGIDTSRMSGCSSDLKVATRMTKVMRIAASSARPICVKASCCSAVAPPKSTVTPCGVSTSSAACCTALLAAPRSLPAGVTVTVTER